MFLPSLWSPKALCSCCSQGSKSQLRSQFQGDLDLPQCQPGHAGLMVKDLRLTGVMPYSQRASPTALTSSPSLSVEKASLNQGVLVSGCFLPTVGANTPPLQHHSSKPMLTKCLGRPLSTWSPHYCQRIQDKPPPNTKKCPLWF